MELSLEYSNFKNRCSDFKIQYEEFYIRDHKQNIKGYYLWAEDGLMLFTCKIVESENITDFETNYKDDANQKVTKKDALGNTVISQSYGYTPELPCWERYKYTAAAGQTTFFDEAITTEKRVRYGQYKIKNYSDVHEDDYMELSIIDKDDVLGLFSVYGLIVGEDILELNKIVKNEYCDNEYEFSAGTWGAMPIYAGLYVRTAYNNYGNTDINFWIRILFYE